MNQKTSKKTARKKPEKKADVLTIHMYNKPIVRVLPEYDNADDAQKLRACAMLNQFIYGQIITILDRAEDPKDPKEPA